MKISELLTEGLSPVLYHATGIDRAISILRANAIKATPVVGVDRDSDVNGDARGANFVSFARSRTGGYIHSVPSSLTVCFEFDGRALQSNYSGKAVDYFSVKNSRSRVQFELEDRVITHDAEIKNIQRYIDVIHVIYSDLPDSSLMDLASAINREPLFYLNQLVDLSRIGRGHKIVVWGSIKDFKTRSKGQSAPLVTFLKQATGDRVKKKIDPLVDIDVTYVHRRKLQTEFGVVLAAMEHIANGEIDKVSKLPNSHDIIQQLHFGGEISLSQFYPELRQREFPDAQMRRFSKLMRKTRSRNIRELERVIGDMYHKAKK